MISVYARELKKSDRLFVKNLCKCVEVLDVLHFAGLVIAKFSNEGKKTSISFDRCERIEIFKKVVDKQQQTKL